MSIVLFLPFFEPASEARKKELQECLERNVACAEIETIVLLIDDDAVPHVDSPKIEIVKLDHRPTYADWIEHSRNLAADSISVLANADIYFDRSVEKLKDLLSYDPTGFVALSRYERLAGVELLHSNPHWSQDAWAMLPSASTNRQRDKFLDFPLGIPRCDNKVAYVFAVYGHRIYNPCSEVKIVHLHETGLRTYDKRGDRQLVGGVAMVRASEDLFTPARLEVEVWSVATTQFASLKLNKSFERWSEQDRIKREQEAMRPVATAANEEPLPRPYVVEPSLLAFDEHWQFPAVTEAHAWRQMQLFRRRNLDIAYVGFPWATLIDLLKHNKKDQPRIELLQQALRTLSSRLGGYRRVLTVCQHIHLLQFLSLFEEIGVTDIFWSHCPDKIDRAVVGSSVALHPFPLYPVQTAAARLPFAERPHLFSFIGAKASKGYLTQARTFIVEELQAEKDGLVIERSSWHYNKIVYDGQILARTAVSGALVDESASAEFRDVMALSKFALCPSGTGPNSIRLWEALTSGVIPVVMADSYRPPCDRALWERAVVVCGEDRESVRALPDRLRAIAADSAGVSRRLDAGAILAQRYGRTNFVRDVIGVFDAHDEAARASA